MLFDETKHGIVDGKPYTGEDTALFTDLTAEEQALAVYWVLNYLKPINNICYDHTSYGMKHYLEQDTCLYMSNNQFKHLMLLCGFQCDNEHNMNWCFNVYARSRAYQRHWERPRGVVRDEFRQIIRLYEGDTTILESKPREWD